MTYQCDQCGACCRKLIIEIDHIDVVREPSLLSVVTLMDGNGRVQYESEWEKEYMLACGAPCPKLSHDDQCTIYPSRPNCCVAFEAGSEQCQEIRRASGLPRLEEVS